MTSRRLVVLGAVNVDLVVRGPRLPGPGETVVGGVFERHHGGKGANQAVAAARALRGTPLEDRVSFLGAIGGDEFGAEARTALEAERIDLSWLKVASGTPTGVALIVVDRTGENQIAVALGANAEVTAEDVETAVRELESGSVVLASLEVPFASVARAAELCRERGITFILNPAPATPATAAILPLATVATPNKGELQTIAPGSTGASLAAAHPGLSVVITRGADGVEVSGSEGTSTISVLPVDAVDTTGAGDCLNGVLAAGLFEGRSLLEAGRRAVSAAAISVMVAGAREGMPIREAIDPDAGARPGRGA